MPSLYQGTKNTGRNVLNNFMMKKWDAMVLNGLQLE